MVVDGVKMDVTFEGGQAVKMVNLSTLTATNSLKGGINIYKKIVDKDGNDITADVKDKQTEFTIHGSITKDGIGTTLEYRLMGDEYTDENGEKGRSAKRTIDDSASFDITLHAGDQIRIVNVPSGYSYTFYEEKPGDNCVYSFYSINGEAVDADRNPIDGANIAVKTEEGESVLTGTTVPNAAQNVTVKNKIEKAGFEFSKVWLGMSASIDAIKAEDIQAWKEDNTISVSLKRIDPATNLEDTSFAALTYEINSTDSEFLPTNDDMTADEKSKYPLTKSVKGNITTFTLPKELDAFNSDFKPYIYYVEETAAGTGSFATYYGELTDDGVKKKNGSLSAQNGEAIINQESSGYELPATGGPGVNTIYRLGVMLIALACAGLFMKRRRKSC